MRVYLTRTIAVSHRLLNPVMTEQWNRSTFGKCYEDPAGHGHNFKVQVWIDGPVDLETGMVINFNRIKDVVDFYDHKHLNTLVDFIPTAENLVEDIIESLVQVVPSALSIQVRIWETENGYAEDTWSNPERM